MVWEYDNHSCTNLPYPPLNIEQPHFEYHIERYYFIELKHIPYTTSGLLAGYPLIVIRYVDLVTFPSQKSSQFKTWDKAKVRA